MKKYHIKTFLTDKNFTLGTHQPVIKAVLEIFNPSGILELGAGLKSTPIFYKHNSNVVSIESDKDWYEKVKGSIGNRRMFNLVYHRIGHGVNTKTKYPNITNVVTNECLAFYDKYIDNNMEFLFVDHVSGLRVITLRAIFDRFKIVAYHDAQHPGYFFELLKKEDLSGYKHLMYKSLGVFTGILISNEYSNKMVQKFNTALEKYGKEYCHKFDAEYNHELKDA